MDFIGATVDGGGADNWSYKCAKLQSNRHYQQTIIHLFAGRMWWIPFLSPNQQCLNTEGNFNRSGCIWQFHLS